MNHIPKVGDNIETWFSCNPDGKSTVLKVEPYCGKYKELFSHVLTVTAPRTQAGYLKLCWPI